MMKKHHRGKAAGARRHAVAASFLVSTAAGILSLSAHAQQAATQPPPTLAIAKAATPGESIAAPTAMPIETAPSLKGTESADTLAASVAPSTDGGAGGSTARSAARQTEDSEDLVWLLPGETMPWPLSYTELNPLNGLYFSLPSEKQARIMLPGYVADAAQQARFVVTRYVTDSIGSAAQQRARQLEAFNVWADHVAMQKRMLSTDPWVIYAFNKQALSVAAGYKAKIQAQTEPTVRRMAQDINSAVEKITPVMSAMQGYDQQIQWYNVLVQLKEGIGMYQSRAAEGDQQVLQAITAFERDNPVVARPEGSPPTRADSVRAPVPNVTPAAAEMTAPADVERQPASAPAKKQETSSSAAGVIVLLAVFACVVGFFMKLRKRVAGKGKAKAAANS